MVEKIHDYQFESYRKDLPQNDNINLTQAIQRERDTGFKLLDRAELPQLKRIETSLISFYQNPEAVLDQLPSERYAFNFIKGIERHRNHGYTKEQLLRYISGMENKTDYLAIIREFHDNLYGGNLQFLPENTNLDYDILLEMKPGEQRQVASQNMIPDIIVRRNIFTKRFMFEGEITDEVRNIIFSGLLQPLALDGDVYTGIKKLKFKPSHYEFIMIRRTENSPLEALFLDERDESIFHTVDIDASMRRSVTIPNPTDSTELQRLWDEAHSLV